MLTLETLRAESTMRGFMAIGILLFFGAAMATLAVTTLLWRGTARLIFERCLEWTDGESTGLVEPLRCTFHVPPRQRQQPNGIARSVEWPDGDAILHSSATQSTRGDTRKTFLVPFVDECNGDLSTTTAWVLVSECPTMPSGLL